MNSEKYCQHSTADESEEYKEQDISKNERAHDKAPQNDSVDETNVETLEQKSELNLNSVGQILRNIDAKFSGKPMSWRISSSQYKARKYKSK